jgi:hypothetical protein
MIKRISVISTAVLAALLFAGLAWATPDDSTSSSSTSTTSTTAAQASGAGTGTQTYQADAAGLVTVDQAGASLSISEVTPNSGWSSEVESGTGREVEVKFVNGNQRIDFQAELEDGSVKTRVRSRPLDESGNDDRTLFEPSGATMSFDAGEAGTVHIGVADGSLTLESANPNAGWGVADIEIEGTREITVEFSNGTLEIEFKAEMEDGLVKSRVRTELLDTSGRDVSNDDPEGDDAEDGSDSDDGEDDSSDD